MNTVCARDGERGADARAEARYGHKVLYKSGILGIRSSVARAQLRVRTQTEGFRFLGEGHVFMTEAMLACG